MILENIKKCSLKQIREFSCGNPSLDSFFHSYAKSNDKSGYGKTFVLIKNEKIIGYFTLCNAQVKFETFPCSLLLKMPKYPIPAIRIARLAVSKEFQGKGFGAELLKNAFLKILSVAETVGTYLIVVDAKETSASFYEHYGFQRLLDEKLTYFLTISTLKSALK